jgi:hypothetical protein
MDENVEPEAETVEAPEPVTGTNDETGETPAPEAATANGDDVQAIENALKEARADAIKYRNRLRKLEAAQKERDEAELTEAERQTRRLQELEETLAERETTTRRLALESAVAMKANSLGIVDAEVAVAMLDTTAFDYDDDGRPDPEGLDNALRRLLKAKPYLRTQPAAGSPANPAKSEPLGETDDQRRARLFGGNSGVFDPNTARRMGGGVVNSDS